MSHTPTPWRSVILYGSSTSYDVYDAQDRWIATCYALKYSGCQMTPEEAQANSAHIVHCVNAHAALVEALGNLECCECQHKLRLHIDKYGCEVERGDKQVQDVGAVAMGPCGCDGHYPQEIAAIAALRLAKGGTL